MFQSRKSLPTILALALVLMLAAGTIALALASGPVDEDASVYSNDLGLNQNADKLRAEAGTPNCAASRTRWSYLKWNVADAAGKPGQFARITLTADLINLGAATPGNVFIGLYETTDGWTESTVNAGNGPAIGSLLVSIPVPATPGTLIFEGDNLVNYIMTQANGDGVASLVVALSGNCGEGSVLVRMWSKDQSNPNLAPTLDLRTGPPPTAVDMSAVSAEQIMWPFYAGLAALVVIAAAGVAWSRRRATQR